MIRTLEEIFQRAKKYAPKKIAVAGTDDSILESLKRAKKEGLISKSFLINGSKELDVAEKAVKLVKEGKADILMKGTVKTSKIIKAILAKEGFKKAGLISHVYAVKLPRFDRMLVMTDGGIIPEPTLEQKIKIAQNAINFCREILEIKIPKVVALCATEEINPKIPSTSEAAKLAKLSRTGVIKNGIVEGPLALDDALFKHVALRKQIKSKISGKVDILLVPHIDCGNILGKSMVYFGGGVPVGLVIGTTKPVVIVSRGDSQISRFYAIALGVLAGGKMKGESNER